MAPPTAVPLSTKQRGKQPIRPAKPADKDVDRGGGRGAGGGAGKRGTPAAIALLPSVPPPPPCLVGAGCTCDACAGAAAAAAEVAAVRAGRAARFVREAAEFEARPPVDVQVGRFTVWTGKLTGNMNKVIVNKLRYVLRHRRLLGTRQLHEDMRKSLLGDGYDVDAMSDELLEAAISIEDHIEDLNEDTNVVRRAPETPAGRSPRSPFCGRRPARASSCPPALTPASPRPPAPLAHALGGLAALSSLSTPPPPTVRPLDSPRSFETAQGRLLASAIGDLQRGVLDVRLVSDPWAAPEPLSSGASVDLNLLELTPTVAGSIVAGDEGVPPRASPSPQRGTAALGDDPLHKLARKATSLLVRALRGMAAKHVGLSCTDDSLPPPMEWTSPAFDGHDEWIVDLLDDDTSEPIDLSDSGPLPPPPSRRPLPTADDHPAYYGWALWLSSRLACLSKDSVGKRALLDAGPYALHARAVSWRLLYLAASMCDQVDPLTELAPILSLGQALSCSGAVMREHLQRHDSSGAMDAVPGDRSLPWHGDLLRSTGLHCLVSPYCMHNWLAWVCTGLCKGKFVRSSYEGPTLPRRLPSSRPGLAAEVRAGLRYARDELERLLQLAAADGKAQVAEVKAMVEVTHRAYVFAWNPNGISLSDAVGARRQHNRKRHSDDNAAAIDAALNASVAKEKAGNSATGSGSKLDVNPCPSLNAAIRWAIAHKAGAMILDETHVAKRDAASIADYIGTKLNWRVQRSSDKWADPLVPEYDACVLQACAEAQQCTGVLFAWNPAVMTVVSHEVVVPGRVLLVIVSMLDDGLRYGIFACYMPQSGLAKSVHHEAWTSLQTALLNCSVPRIVAGDLNGETAQRLRRGGIDCSKVGWKSKRHSETYLYDLMHGETLGDGETLKRLGKEYYTYRTGPSAETVAALDSVEAVAAQTSRTVIDHVLVDSSAVRCTPAGTHLIQSDLVKYHLAVAFYITTVAAERIEHAASLKPRLAKMPVRPATPRAGGKAVPLGKRALRMARDLPLYEGSDLHGIPCEVYDDEDDDLPTVVEDENDEDPIGWELFLFIAVEVVRERLATYVANRVLAITSALRALGSNASRSQRSKVQDEAARDYILTHGTRIDCCMNACMHAARRCIGAAGDGATGGAMPRSRSKREILRRRLELYTRIQQEVEELPPIAINFTNTGVLPARWLISSAAVSPEVRALFHGTSVHVQPDERKLFECALLDKLISSGTLEHHEESTESGMAKVNEELTAAAINEYGYFSAAQKVIKRERPGVVSIKDSLPGRELNSIIDDAGILRTGAAADAVIESKVAAANVPKFVDLEAVGHLFDVAGLTRANTQGGPTGRDCGAFFQIAERYESQRRAERNTRRDVARARLKAPPEGDYVVVGNKRRPLEKHNGRLQLLAMRGTLFGSPFSMGEDGHDEAWRDCVCLCYPEWLDGVDAYDVARKHGLPLEFVHTALAKVHPDDLEAELDAVVRMIVELDQRVVLLCCCMPKRCHLEHLAALLNERVAKKLVDVDGAVDDAAASSLQGVECVACVDEEGYVDEDLDPDRLVGLDIVVDGMDADGSVPGFAPALSLSPAPPLSPRRHRRRPRRPRPIHSCPCPRPSSLFSCCLRRCCPTRCRGAVNRWAPPR